MHKYTKRLLFLHKYTLSIFMLEIRAKKKFPSYDGNFFGGAYETRTRDPMRDRHVF